MNPLSEIEIEPPTGFSLHETVHAHGWRALQPFAWEDGTLERIERLSDGQVIQLAITQPAEDMLRLRCSEPTPADEIISRVRAMLQMEVLLDYFHAFCAGRTELAQIPVRNHGRMLRSPTLWEDTVKVIATSNTTWVQTKSMVARLCEHFGSPLASDPARHAFPAPQQIAAIPFEEFAAKARMGYRNAYVFKLATSIADGALDLESWNRDDLPSDVLRKRLLSLPGIGPYGAACLLLYSGHAGHVNVDSWARTLVAREMGRPVTDKEVQTFFESYGEWRGLVYTFYPWRGENAGETAI